MSQAMPAVVGKHGSANWFLETRNCAIAVTTYAAMTNGACSRQGFSVSIQNILYSY